MKHDHDIIMEIAFDSEEGDGTTNYYRVAEKYSEHQNAALIARVAELEGALAESHIEKSISKRFADALTKKCMTAMGAAARGIVDGVMADCLKDRRSIKPHPLLQEKR